MSIQKKLIEDILSSYDIINGNKNMVFEVADTYNNIEFRNIGHGNPSSDNINTTLLQDIQTAAKSAGVNVSVTTAISGHGKKTKSGNESRHPSGNAVDIAMINGKAVSTSNRADADKLVNALVSMGYNKNAEGPSNPKAVLTFGFEGHDDHVHVSNTGGASTQQPTTSGSTSNSTSTETETSTTGTEDYTGGAGKFAREIGGKILNVIGIKESFEPSSFGNNVQSNRGKVMIPKKSNSKIKSPVSGVIVDINTSQSCINQTVIEFNEGYLEYCGITNPSLKTGDKVKVGNSLGTTNSNVTVTLFSRKKNKKDIELDDEKPKDSKPKNRDSLLVKGYHNLKKSSKEKEPETKSDNTNKSNYLLVRGYQKLKKSFDKTPDKKLDENIERIKGLLK